MKLFETVEQRRAIKHYNGEGMTEAEFEQLMSAVILSPTSYNIQNWRFVRVQDKALRAEIQLAAWGQEQVSAAAELIILCADNNAWNDRPERYWANADQGTQDMLLPVISSFYTNKPQVQRDEAMRSCGMAAQTLMLAAKAMGYDTCPMIGFDPETLAELINLPEEHVIAMMITIGKAEQTANPRGGQLPLADVLIEDHF